MLHFLAAQIVSTGFRITPGEWYCLLGLAIGLIVGVHMAQPRYVRRRD